MVQPTLMNPIAFRMFASRPAVPLFVLEIAFVLCWSSSYVTAEFALAGSAPFTVLFVRYVAAALLLWGWVVVLGQTFPRSWRVLTRIAIVGILSNAVWLAALYIALDLGVTSGTGALLTSVQPLASAVLGLVLFGQRLAVRQSLGVVLGIVGVYLVVAEDVAMLSAPLWAYTLPLISVAAIAVSYVIEKGDGAEEAATPISLSVRLMVQFAASAIVLTPFAWFEGFPFRPDPVVVLAFAWQIIGLSIASYGLMWAILDRSDAMRTSALMPLMPPTTLAISALLLAEPIGPTKLIGFAVAVAGVAMMRRSSTSPT